MASLDVTTLGVKAVLVWASDGRKGNGLRRTVDDGECHVLNVVLRN